MADRPEALSPTQSRASAGNLLGLALAVVWVACVPAPGFVVPGGTASELGRPDLDGDGFAPLSEGGEDCNDADPDINPLATEICGDQVDNDCDGNIDDSGVGNVVQFIDADGDGFGAAEGTRLACPGALSELGYVLVSGDCNDANALAHPDMPSDGCDQVDSDCDGQVDEDARFRVDGQVVGTLAVAAFRANSSGIPSVIEVCADAGGINGSNFTFNGQADVILRGLGPVEDLVVEDSGSTPLINAADGARVTIENLTLTDARFGAVVASGRAQVVLDGVVLRDNLGGGIRILGSNTGSAMVQLHVLDSMVEGNGGPGLLGGGLYAQGGFQIDIERTVFGANEAANGGGIYAARDALGASELTLVDSALLDNVASYWGGGLYAAYVPVNLSDTAINGNRAVQGGGMHLDNASVEGAGSTFVIANTAADKGGGLSMSESSVTATIVHGNVAGEGGGIVSFSAHGGNTVNELDQVEVSKNVASFVGGGLTVSPSQLILRDSSVVNNLAQTVFPATGIVIEGLGGGAYLEFQQSGASLTSINVDWGQLTTDNQPNDVEHIIGVVRKAGPGASFTCSWVGCT